MYGSPRYRLRNFVNSEFSFAALTLVEAAILGNRRREKLQNHLSFIRETTKQEQHIQNRLGGDFDSSGSYFWGR